jgi:hypothetical protein
MRQEFLCGKGPQGEVQTVERVRLTGNHDPGALPGGLSQQTTGIRHRVGRIDMKSHLAHWALPRAWRLAATVLRPAPAIDRVAGGDGSGWVDNR